MFSIWRTPNGLLPREKAAHDRAHNLIKLSVGISFAFPPIALKVVGPPTWEIGAMALGTYLVVAGLYAGAIAALTEVRTIRVAARTHRRALRLPEAEPSAFMADFDLVALLLAAALPIAIVMLSVDLIPLHH